MSKIFEIKNLSVYTLDNKNILKNINIYINKKEKVLLEGENGIGKSTLLNAIFKNPNYKIEVESIKYYKEIINPNSNKNKTKLEEIEFKDLETFEIARHGVFYAMQNVPEIEGLSTIKFLYKAYENFVLFEENIVNTKLSILEFKNQILKYCEEFDIDQTLIDRDLNLGFSGGEKKQAMLLHMLVLKPKIIFADEPESGVDKISTDKVYKVLNYLVKNGSSLFVISHNEKTESKLKIDRKYILKYDPNTNKVLEEFKK